MDVWVELILVDVDIDLILLNAVIVIVVIVIVGRIEEVVADKIEEVEGKIGLNFGWKDSHVDMTGTDYCECE